MHWVRHWAERLVGAAAAIMLGLASTSRLHAAPCDDLDWTSVAHGAQSRSALVPADLVRLRDVGPAGNELPDVMPFSLSPDGKRIAFQIRRADPAGNSYCLAMVVMDTSPNAVPVFVDRGGTLLQFPASMAGQGGLDTGIPTVITPRWSPDGRWIAYLRRDAGATRLWRASSDGRGSSAVTAPAWNVVDFRVVDAEHALVRFQDQSQGEAQVVQSEALHGYHYDDRFLPVASSLPVFAPAAPIRAAMLEVATGDAHPVADSDAAAQFARLDEAGLASPVGDRVSLVPASAELDAHMTITVSRPGKQPVTCAPAVCGDVERAPWWNAKHDRIVFFRRAGWANSRTEVASWRPDAKRARVLYSADDELIACSRKEVEELVCLRETALQPRHLVSINLQHGKVVVLADFNPELAEVTMGAVSRMRLTSSFGLPAFADLVLPVGYQPGQRYPLIVVQYRSRGFLRGGVGDEFPIQAFANRGYAVLSVDRPEPVGLHLHPSSWTDVDRLGLVDFADRRNVLSVIEQAVQQLIDRGIADPAAIGITGLSDGSSTVQFAELNSHLFAAGIVSGCCWERGQDALLGSKGHQLYSRIGWPSLTEPAPAFWSRISLEQNAKRAAFPLLFEMADDEFRAALASFVALRETGQAADMFVYPGEHHIKWQPAHRLAAYRRSIDWFDFWLKGLLPTDPDRHNDALRWMELRDQVDTSSGR